MLTHLPYGEFNKDYQVSATPTPKEFSTKIPSDNPTINRNKGECLK